MRARPPWRTTAARSANTGCHCGVHADQRDRRAPLLPRQHLAVAERRLGIEDDVRQRIPPPRRIGRQRPPLVGPRVPEQANAVGRAPVLEAVGRRLGRLRALAAIARIGRIEIGSIGNDRLQHQHARRRHDVGTDRDQLAEPQRADRARTKHAQPARRRARAGGSSPPASANTAGSATTGRSASLTSTGVGRTTSSPLAASARPGVICSRTTPAPGAGLDGVAHLQAAGDAAREGLAAHGDPARLPALALLQRRRGERAARKQVRPPQPVGRGRVRGLRRQRDDPFAVERVVDRFDAHVRSPAFFRFRGRPLPPTASSPAATAGATVCAGGRGSRDHAEQPGRDRRQLLASAPRAIRSRPCATRCPSPGWTSAGAASGAVALDSSRVRPSPAPAAVRLERDGDRRGRVEAAGRLGARAELAERRRGQRRRVGEARRVEQPRDLRASPPATPPSARDRDSSASPRPVEALAHALDGSAVVQPPRSAATRRRDRRDRRADGVARTRGSAAAPAAATRRPMDRPGSGSGRTAPAAAAAAGSRAACAARRDSAPPDEADAPAWSGASTTARHSLRGTGARIATAVESSASPGSVRSIGGSASASSTSAGSSSSGTIEKSASTSAGK